MPESAESEPFEFKLVARGRRREHAAAMTGHSPEDSSTPSTVAFSYLKSQHFRVVHVDGAIGGPTPRGLLHVAVYSERLAIPQRLEFQVKADGKLGDRIQDEQTRGGVVRELETSLMFDLASARAFRDWFVSAVKQLEDIQKGAGSLG